MAASIMGTCPTTSIPQKREASSPFERAVLRLAREALRTPLSVEEKAFIGLVEMKCERERQKREGKA